VSDIKLSSNKLSDYEFSNNELSENELSYSELSDSELSENELSENKLSNSELSENGLSDNKLSDTKLSDNELSHNKLSGSELSYSKLSDSENSDNELYDDDDQCIDQLFRSGLPKNHQFYDLYRYNYLTVSFIHRTAYDFLIDTAAGQEVLVSSPDSCNATSRLFKAYLLRCSIFLLRIYSRYPHEHGSVLYKVDNFLNLILESKANLDEETATYLFSLCQEWYTASKLVSVLSGPVDINYRIYKTAFFAAVAYTDLAGMAYKHLQNAYRRQT